MRINELIELEQHGAFCIVQPLRGAAKAWLEQNVDDDAIWYGGGLFVEARCVVELVGAMEKDLCEPQSELPTAPVESWCGLDAQDEPNVSKKCRHGRFGEEEAS